MSMRDDGSGLRCSFPPPQPCGALECVWVSRGWGGWWAVGVEVVAPDGCPVLATDRSHRTLYGARMAARQARIDYSPGGRLCAPVV